MQLTLSPNLKNLCLAPSKNYQKQGHGKSTNWSNVCFAGFKSSVRDLFSKSKDKIKKKEIKSSPSEVSLITSPATPCTTSGFSSCTIYNFTTIISGTATLIDPELLQACYELYEALHDPSILDARRHQRYSLYPPAFAETPQSTISGILLPPCRRGFVLYEFSAATTLSLPPSPPCIAPEPNPTKTVASAPSQELVTKVSDEKRVMNIADLHILRFLGEGTSGKVYFARDKVSRAKVALKVVSKGDKSDFTLGVVIQERFISASLSDSPWFVNLYATWHDDANLYIAMTAYPTDLDSEMIRCGVIEPERARFYMAEIIIALTELHSRGIIHRDIKSPNILIDREGHVVLADFGLSKDFGLRPTIAERVYQPYWPYFRDENVSSESEPRDPEELYFVAWDYRGSELEMAPEIHLRQPYAFGVDFWSAAVVLYWMLTGRPPWYEDEEEYEDEGELDVKPLPFKIAEDPLTWDVDDNVDEDTKDFLEQMLEKDPKRRLMITYGMPNHPYFTGINWAAMEKRLIPPPWIPEQEVYHAYEPSTPMFVPGTPFVDEDADPCPEFMFMSKNATFRAIIDDDDDDGIGTDSESDADSDTSTITNVEIMYIATSYEDTSVTRGMENETRTLNATDSILEDDRLKEVWDLAIVTRPSGKPCGPGPKLWLSAHDIINYMSSISKALPSPAIPRFPEDIGKNSTFSPSKASSNAVLDPSLPLLEHEAEEKPLQHSPAIYFPPVIPQQRSHGIGILSKVKKWFSNLWAHSPRTQV